MLTLTVLEVLGKLAAGRISIRPPLPLAILFYFVFFFLLRFPLAYYCRSLRLIFSFPRERGFCRVLKALWQRELSCRSPSRGFDAVLGRKSKGEYVGTYALRRLSHKQRTFVVLSQDTIQ